MVVPLICYPYIFGVTLDREQFFAHYSFKNAMYRTFYKQNKKILLAVLLCSHIPLHIVVSVAKEALKFKIVSLSVFIALSVAQYPLSKTEVLFCVLRHHQI